jgi:hypothetical protein
MMSEEKEIVITNHKKNVGYRHDLLQNIGHILIVRIWEKAVYMLVYNNMSL